MKDLLICIAFHYTDFTYPFVCNVLKNITNSYKCSYHIVVHTNQQSSAELLKCNFKDVETIVAENKGYNLTWEHRAYIAKNMHNYENCMYLEDDIVVPYDTYIRYLENFWTLWPTAVPGLLRYEKVGENKFFNELKGPNWQTWTIDKNNKIFAYWRCPYSAMWILPTKILKKCVEFLKEDFLSNVATDREDYIKNGIKQAHHLIRENAASFTNWQLGKPTYVELGEKPKHGEILNIPDTSTCAHGSNKYYGVRLLKPGELWNNIKYEHINMSPNFRHTGRSFTDKIKNL